MSETTPASGTPLDRAARLRKTPSTKGELSVEKKFKAREIAWKKQPLILRNHHAVYLGDSRQMHQLLPSQKVHLVVTSPPYWNLKRYNPDSNDAQLGHIDDLTSFLESLNQVWRECFLRLVPGGRMCVVVGDVCRSRKAFGRHRVEPLHSHIQIECQRLGFDPLAPIIWSKITNLKTEVNGNGSPFLGKPYEPNGVIKNDVEYILQFRKPGDYRHPSQVQRDLSMISKDDHAKWFRQVWTDVPGESQRTHPAPFPAEIASRLIGMFSFVGDTVLDPFWGSGNTSVAAIRMSRSSIGVEIDRSYIVDAKSKFSCLPPSATINFNFGR